jgi:hypothetical protein
MREITVCTFDRLTELLVLLVEMRKSPAGETGAL